MGQLPPGLANWIKNNPQKAAANRAKFTGKKSTSSPSSSPRLAPSSTPSPTRSSTPSPSMFGSSPDRTGYPSMTCPTCGSKFQTSHTCPGM